MSFATDLQDCLVELETELGTTMIWKAVSYPCVANRLKRGTVVTLGAKEEVISLTLQVRKTALPTPVTAAGAEVTTADAMSTATAATAPPSSGHRITFQGVVYRVLTVSEGPGRAFYEIDLADINR